LCYQVTVALGFEMKGGWKELKNTTALSVLVTMMGGGGSFSAGGPGKGMYSRLYQRVLNRHPWISNCSAFQNGYNHTGLVGLMTTCPGDKAKEAVDIMVAELQAVAGAEGAISAQELARAKNATIASVNFNLESKAIVCEDIGRQLLTYGTRISAEQFVKDVHALTAKDLTACAKALLKSPLTMASIGPIDHVPTYADVANKFVK
jgi:processing peptidase subunit alpha